MPNKDEFRIKWLYNDEVVGWSPEVWQKRATAIKHAEDWLDLIRVDMGINLMFLSYEIEERTYTVSREEWV